MRLQLRREESDGGKTALAVSENLLSLSQEVARGEEYERGQRLEIVDDEYDGDDPLAVWTPETGWETSGQSGEMEAHLKLHEVSERLYAGLESLEPIATDLCYLFAAISSGKSVEWEASEGEASEGEYTDKIKIFKGLFPERHFIWKHIDILENAESGIKALDTCPVCGEQSIVAVCRTVVEYTVENTDCGEQDWGRMDIGDSSEPLYFRCENCNTQFDHFKMDGEFLVRLTVPDEPKSISEAGFLEWLKARSIRFFNISEDDPALEDDTLDFGVLWGEIESNDELSSIGVSWAADHKDEIVYFAGKDAEGNSWLIGSYCDNGINGETIWLNPLAGIIREPDLWREVAHSAAVLKQRAEGLSSMLTV